MKKEGDKRNDPGEKNKINKLKKIYIYILKHLFLNITSSKAENGVFSPSSRPEACYPTENAKVKA